MLAERIETGDIGDEASACTSRLELLDKPVDVVNASPLELLPLCSGMVCRIKFCEAAFAAGLVGTGDGLAGKGASSGLEGTGFRGI